LQQTTTFRVKASKKPTPYNLFAKNQPVSSNSVTKTTDWLIGWFYPEQVRQARYSGMLHFNHRFSNLSFFRKTPLFKY
jgi:hypothetical protein